MKTPAPGPSQPGASAPTLVRWFELGDGRSRARRAAVDEDIAAAVAIVDLVVTFAVRAIVAEETAAAISCTVAAIDIPGERRLGRLVARREGADIESSAPLRHGVVNENVADNAERIAKEIEPTAMRAAGLRARIAFDAVARSIRYSDWCCR